MDYTFIVLAFIYFIPGVVALERKKSNRAAIIVLNVFLGWTFVGWVVALVWACTKDERPSEADYPVVRSRDPSD